MTIEIGFVLAVLVLSFILFITEWIRMDVVALLVLAVLAISGLVSPEQALSGFSNPAVVTVWAMFMLSAGLTQTGIANMIGRRVLKLAGTGEIRMIIVIMLTGGILSAFMNNIGVAALMLPVVMDIARRTGRPPSRLLMPLAYSTLLGGLTTLIGTAPNLLVSEAMHENGLRPFGLFDFAPVGGAIMIAGTLFFAFIGRLWLPKRDPMRESSEGTDLASNFSLGENTVEMVVPAGSPLDGLTLGQSRLGSATGLNVFAVSRNDETIPAPGHNFVLQANDRLEVGGSLNRLKELQGWRELELEQTDLGLDSLSLGDVGLAELQLSSDCDLIGKDLRETDFRSHYGLIVLAIRRGNEVHLDGLAEIPLHAQDRLLVQGHMQRIEELRTSKAFESQQSLPQTQLAQQYSLDHRLFVVRVPDESILIGKSLAESRLGEALAIGVVGILRGGNANLLPEPSEMIRAQDRLLVRGKEEDLVAFHGLQQLEIASGDAGLRALQSERIGLVEVTLSPRSSFAGRSLREIAFRQRFGLQAMAILREGQTHRSHLRDMPLRFGDVLLLVGSRERAIDLAKATDFIVLTQTLRESTKNRKAIVAGLILLAVLAPVLLGFLPIAICAVAGATLMVLTGCLKMEDAYRAIEWRAIFLIAGMLPLGTALQQSGAAAFLAEGVLNIAGSMGPWGVVIGLYLVTAVATMVIPTAALVVLMAPIVLKASADMGIDPHSAMMAMSIAASASFTSPISHPANLLVMGPGGYQFKDYVKIGVPLTIVVLLVTLLLLPWVWPL
jgi:di/tricarboxylate transporter